jgi:hypothetical protein
MCSGGSEVVHGRPDHHSAELSGGALKASGVGSFGLIQWGPLSLKLSSWFPSGMSCRAHSLISIPRRISDAIPVGVSKGSRGIPLWPPCVKHPTHSQPSPHWQVPVASLQPGSTISCQKYEDGDSVEASSSFPSLGLSANTIVGLGADDSVFNDRGAS